MQNGTTHLILRSHAETVKASGHDAPPQGRQARMDRISGHRAAVPALLDGPDGPAPRRTAAHRGPRAEQRAAAVDHRYLRVPARGLTHYDGHARRPDRPAAAAADRRRVLRGRVDPGGV